MITKGGLATITQQLAMEYAKDGIRVNAVTPGIVYTPMQRETPKDVMESRSPMGRASTVKDITDAIMHLTDAQTVTGHILYVDGGAPFRLLVIARSGAPRQGAGQLTYERFPVGRHPSRRSRHGLTFRMRVRRN